MLLLCDNFCWLIVPRSMHPMCVLCVSSLLVCVIIRKERRLKKGDRQQATPPPSPSALCSKVNTARLCTSYSCDAGAGAVRERETAFFYLCFSSIFLLLLHSSTTYMKSFVCVVVLSSLLDVYSYIHLHFKTYLSVCCWAVTRCLSLSYTSESLEVTMTFLPKFHGCTE